MLRLLQKLKELSTRRDTNHINNFDQYVARVAINTCNEYLRNKTPERSTLNKNLRDLMCRHRDFSVWKDEYNSLLCGFAVWKKRTADTFHTISPEQSDAILQTLRKSGLVRSDLQRFPYGKILNEIFRQVGHPIEFSRLTELVASLLMIKDRTPESLDQNKDGFACEVIDASSPPDIQIEGRERLRKMWEEVRRMPA
ncbi:MAG TPA: hypothetical protein VJS64_03155, partial [Pyrinomonadaceae bacterium]|nr:hypothetical protein [Pyrinomonadaceae bacterium]